MIIGGTSSSYLKEEAVVMVLWSKSIEEVKLAQSDHAAETLAARTQPMIKRLRKIRGTPTARLCLAQILQEVERAVGAEKIDRALLRKSGHPNTDAVAIVNRLRDIPILS